MTVLVMEDGKLLEPPRFLPINKLSTSKEVDIVDGWFPRNRMKVGKKIVILEDGT